MVPDSLSYFFFFFFFLFFLIYLIFCFFLFFSLSIYLVDSYLFLLYSKRITVSAVQWPCKNIQLRYTEQQIENNFWLIDSIAFECRWTRFSTFLPCNCVIHLTRAHNTMPCKSALFDKLRIVDNNLHLKVTQSLFAEIKAKHLRLFKNLC